ncbi:MAG: GNAT family N-acetyltransferase [Phycisphaerales bacterium]
MLSIRPVTTEDASAIVDLLNPIIGAGKYTAISEAITVEEQLAFIRSLPPRGVYLAAIDEPSTRLLGIQDVLPHADAESHGEISTFVLLDHRGRGIGSALMRATVLRAVMHGYTHLRAVIQPRNAHAIAFYAAMGFVDGNPPSTESRIMLKHLHRG